MTPPIFRDWHQPLLPQAVRDLIPDHAAGHSLDLSAHTVVVPGGRAMRRLEELLVERAQELGVFLTPPRITTLGQLPELLFERDGALASPQALTLAWAETLRSFSRDRLSALYGRLPGDGALAEWVRMARQLQALHREIAAGAQLFDVVSTKVSGAEAERWSVLADVQTEVLARLDREGLSDLDQSRIEAVRSGQIGFEGEVWLIGIPEISGIARAFLERISDRLTVLVHAPEDCRELFDVLGAIRVDAWLKRESSLDDDRLRVAEGPSEQARHVVEIIAEAAAEDPTLQPEDIVVGALDADVIPFLEEKVGEAGLHARDAAGRPITAAAPLRLLSSTAALLTGRRWEAFAEWVRHPDIDRCRKKMNAEPDSEGLERSDGAVEAEGADSPPSGEGSSALEAPAPPATGLNLSLAALDRWYENRLPVRVELHLTNPEPDAGAEPGQERSIHERVAVLTSTLLGSLAQDTTRQPISQWTEPILEYLARVYDGLDLDESQERDRTLVAALSKVGSELQQWRLLPPGLAPACTAGVALQVMVGAMETGAIPFPPRREAIDILGWLELQLDDAPVAIVAGVHAGTLPESVTGDAFLTDALRTRLQLEDNAHRRARAIYRLSALQHSRRLYLVAGRTSSEGDPLRPSPLMLADPRPQVTARRLIEFYEGDSTRAGEESAREGSAREGSGAEESAGAEAVGLGAAQSAASGQDDLSQFKSPPHSVIRFAAPDSIRATDFKRVLSDPYGFALERMEGCYEQHDRDRELNGGRFGDLAHEVLEQFGRSAAGASADPAVVTKALDEILDEVVRRRFGREARYAQVTVRLQVEQLRSRLRRLAEWQAEWIAEGWQIREVERATEGDGIPLIVDGHPIGVRAKIDRIDHHPELNRWVVWDYKTSDDGGAPEATHQAGRRDDKQWIDLQLPLYKWMAQQFVDQDGTPLIPQGDTVDVGYILLPRDLDAVTGRIADWDGSDFMDAMSAAHEVVRILRVGEVTFDPEVRSHWASPGMDGLLGHAQLAAYADEEAE